MTRKKDPAVLTRPAIRRQLERVLGSPVFSGSERMRRFLDYIVQQHLDGNSEAVKEYALALAVYDKPASFDPRLDAIVRVEAGRLRAKLREYYDNDGRQDPIVIALSAKGYMPSIRANGPDEAEKRELLSSSDGRRRRGTASDKAYSLYLRGRHFWNQRTNTGLNEALDNFQRAIEADPKFAQAWAGLAACHASKTWFEFAIPSEGWPLAEQAASEALRLDPELSDAYATLGYVEAVFRWNWTAAEEMFLKAIELDPDNETAHQWYAVYCLAPQGRLEEAYDQLLQARHLKPFSPTINAHLGLVLHFERRHAEAAQQLIRTIELEPTFYLAYWYLGLARLETKEPELAAAAFREARTLSDNQPFTLATEGIAYSMMKTPEKTAACLRDLEALGRSRFVSPVDLAMIRLATDGTDAAFGALDEAYRIRACKLVHLKVHPLFDPLKTDSRFLQMMKRLNLSS